MRLITYAKVRDLLRQLPPDHKIQAGCEYLKRAIGDHDDSKLRDLGLSPEPTPDSQYVGIPHSEGLRRWIHHNPEQARAAFVISGYFATVLRLLPDPIDRARLVNELVDEAHAGDHGRPITCSKGCSACCYIQVFITEDEAHLIASTHNITKEKLDHWETQSRWSADPQSYCSHPLPKRRCAFLKDNVCSIYEDRPAACRNQLSVSDPKLCDTTKPGQQILYASAIRADMLITAAMQVSSTDAMSRVFTKLYPEPTTCKPTSSSAMPSQPTSPSQS